MLEIKKLIFLIIIFYKSPSLSQIHKLEVFSFQSVFILWQSDQKWLACGFIKLVLFSRKNAARFFRNPPRRQNVRFKLAIAK
jgi:hypothetical protein